MSEPTGSFGEYGNGRWYYDIHDGTDHQRNRYRTAAERDEAAKRARELHPHATVRNGDDVGDSRKAGIERFQIEGLVDGQWSWWNVSADKSEEATLFDSRAEAEAAIPSLAKALECDPSELRVVAR